MSLKAEETYFSYCLNGQTCVLLLRLRDRPTKEESRARLKI